MGRGHAVVANVAADLSLFEKVEHAVNLGVFQRVTMLTFAMQSLVGGGGIRMVRVPQHLGALLAVAGVLVEIAWRVVVFNQPVLFRAALMLGQLRLSGFIMLLSAVSRSLRLRWHQTKPQQKRKDDRRKLL